METLGVAVGEVDAATEPAGDGVAASVAVGVGVGVGVVVPHAPTAAASRSVATAATRAEAPVRNGRLAGVTTRMMHPRAG
jgi:hypothetical protein